MISSQYHYPSLKMSGNTGTYSLATTRKSFAQKLKQHSALNEKHELTPDIYEPLFDWIFQDERFRCWQLDESKWQLRCVGAPGSGKVIKCGVRS